MHVESGHVQPFERQRSEAKRVAAIDDGAHLPFDERRPDGRQARLRRRVRGDRAPRRAGIEDEPSDVVTVEQQVQEDEFALPPQLHGTSGDAVASTRALWCRAAPSMAVRPASGGTALIEKQPLVARSAAPERRKATMRRRSLRASIIQAGASRVTPMPAIDEIADSMPHRMGLMKRIALTVHTVRCRSRWEPRAQCLAAPRPSECDCWVESPSTNMP